MMQLFTRGGLVALMCLAVTSTAAPSAQALSTDQAPVARAAAGEVKTSTSCRPGSYRSRYRITSTAQAPAVTHLNNFTLPPGGKRTISKTAEFERQLTAKVSYDGTTTIGASVAAKVLVQAEVKMNVNLAASGSWTTRKNVSVTDDVSNPTGSNKVFVVYRGYTNATGAFRHYFCKQYYLPGQNYGPSFVTYRTGKWKSYRVGSEGIARCGAGSGGVAIVAAALRLGCR